MFKFKISIVNNTIFLRIPYKGGFAIWELNLAINEWVFRSASAPFSPKKVANFHRQFLNGQKLHRLMVKHAAATHKYDVLSQLQSPK